MGTLTVPLPIDNIGPSMRKHTVERKKYIHRSIDSVPPPVRKSHKAQR